MRPEFLSKLRYINPEMIAALARTGGQVASSMLAQRGWATGDEASTIGGALALIAITAWGMWARRDKALIESATSVPAVHNVVVDPATEFASASLTANPKVNAP